MIDLDLMPAEPRFQFSPFGFPLSDRDKAWLDRFVTINEKCSHCHGRGFAEYEDRRGVTSASLNQLLIDVPCFNCEDGFVDVERCRYCSAEPLYPGAGRLPLCDCFRDAPELTA